MRAPPLVVVAEVTHRCPLRCAYCSNPLALVAGREELDTSEWVDVMNQASELGVLQVHLSGGEPLLRKDLGEVASAAVGRGLYTTLVTSGLGPSAVPRVEGLVRAGVRAVQVSFQDTPGGSARAVSGREAFDEKVAFARRVRELGASLTVNVVLHRDNVARVGDLIELGRALGADRLELAHVQYHGWAERNRAVLLPTRAQIEEAYRTVGAAKRRHAAEMEILHVMPDYYSDRVKPCMGGWGRKAIVIAPDGKVLPCHAASALPLSHDNVRDRSLAEIWAHGSAFQAFRGDDWMEAPCRTCPERHRDFGGCRCQAFALVGRATATDPACPRAPRHGEIVRLRRGKQDEEDGSRRLLRGAGQD